MTAISHRRERCVWHRLAGKDPIHHPMKSVTTDGQRVPRRRLLMIAPLIHIHMLGDPVWPARGENDPWDGLVFKHVWPGPFNRAACNRKLDYVHNLAQFYGHCANNWHSFSLVGWRRCLCFMVVWICNGDYRRVFFSQLCVIRTVKYVCNGTLS